MKRIKELILKKSLTDLDFGRDVLAKLPSSIFDESVELQSVYTVLKRQLISSSTPPTQESLAIKVEKLLSRQKSSEQDITDSIYFLDSLYNVESDKSLSDESVSTEMENYIKAELTKDAIMQSVRNNELEDVEKIGELGEKITKIAVQNLNGQSGTFIDFFKDIEKKKELLENINKYKFPTGYTRLDNAIEGGLSRGELGTISGLTGGGKSLMVTNLIRNYVHRGLNVLLVSLEEKEERIILRSEQQMMGIPKSKILNSDYSLNEKSFDLLQEIYTKKKENLVSFGLVNICHKKYHLVN
ncbi:DnaB-like replicative helicase [Staphylococcus phage Alsa_3]|nr:DnaB-like replicative helicase [Staphylococcus phage Alsa_3]